MTALLVILLSALVAASAILHKQTEARLQRQIDLQRKVVSDQLHTMEDKVDRVAAELARLGDTGAEMQRVLPPLKEALQQFRRFNQTY